VSVPLGGLQSGPRSEAVLALLHPRGDAGTEDAAGSCSHAVGWAGDRWRHRSCPAEAVRARYTSSTCAMAFVVTAAPLAPRKQAAFPRTWRRHP